MVDLRKRRVDVAKSIAGVWVDSIPDFPRLKVKCTAIDTDRCQDRFGDLVEQMYGDRDFEVTDDAALDYLNMRTAVDCAILDMEGLTEGGEPIAYSKAYIEGILFTDPNPDNPNDPNRPTPDVPTPDGKVYDRTAKAIRSMLSFCFLRARTVRLAEEKNGSAVGSGGAAASPGVRRTPTSPPMSSTSIGGGEIRDSGAPATDGAAEVESGVEAEVESGPPSSTSQD